ncbi:MAG: DUF1501 domain-containing protein [Roseovarius sp.]
MTARSSLSRRRFLAQSLGLGCSLAASPLVTPLTFASAPWDHRLVVIILRGGLDGLDAVRPYGAPEFAEYRAPFLQPGEVPGELDLDGYFALGPGLAPLMPLWRAGELGFIHAVSTPYRNKRSHFDGQDILEAGTGSTGVESVRDGWLNRMLQAVPGVEAETAYVIGRGTMLLARGAAPVADWSPDASLSLSPQAERLIEMVMHDDPLFRDATTEALSLSGLAFADGMEEDDPLDTGEMMEAMQANMMAARGKDNTAEIARFAAERLRGDTRIATYSLNGFDTHFRQERTIGKALGTLAENILALREGLGPVWQKTSVVAMTEFGRTARANGTKGTDHGTGGAMLLAGGAVRGGRVIAEWPGLSEADLYERRDLMPTRDLRAHTGWLLRTLFGLERGVIETKIFPGLDLGADPGLLL